MSRKYIRKQLGLVGFLALTLASHAQSFCHGSFSCNRANQSNVVINPAGTGAWSQLYNTGGFTWEAWFRLKAPVVNSSLIVSVEDAVLFQDIFLGFGWGTIPNALSFHVCDDGTNNTVITAESLQTFALNTWYHVGAVCDYANAELRLYLDGNLVAAKTVTADVLAHRMAQDHSAFIGNASTSASGSDIDIDEVRFWSTVRSAAEIQGDKGQCLSLPQPGLVAWFRADDAGPATAKSAVDANFTAALQNAGYASGAPVGDCYTVTVGQTPSSCKTIDFVGTVTGGVTVLDWSWDFGDGKTGNGQDVSHTYGNFGNETATLYLKDNAGCGVTVPAVVMVTPAYVYDNEAVRICQGESFLGHSSSAVFTATVPSPDGCDTIRTYTLTVNDKIYTTVDTTLCEAGAVGGYEKPGTYTDVFRAASGCDSVRVLHIDACGVFIPDAFTPNGDGNNDVFRALNATHVNNFHLVVYNRWGQLVFETRDAVKGWDGRVGGRDAAAGVYIWYCEYAKRGGGSQTVQMKGETVLVR